MNAYELESPERKLVMWYKVKKLLGSKHSRKYVRHIKFDCNLHQCDAGCSLFMRHCYSG